EYFLPGCNLGIKLGEPYGICDIDLDCPEALDIWPEFAPPTGLRWGRTSKPNSHWGYYSDPPAVTIKFEDTIEDPAKPGKTKKETLLELRGLAKDRTVGEQSMVPPSVHPSGERVRFEAGGDGDPANVDLPVLQRAAS